MVEWQEWVLVHCGGTKKLHRPEIPPLYYRVVFLISVWGRVHNQEGVATIWVELIYFNNYEQDLSLLYHHNFSIWMGRVIFWNSTEEKIRTNLSCAPDTRISFFWCIDHTVPWWYVRVLWEKQQNQLTAELPETRDQTRDQISLGPLKVKKKRVASFIAEINDGSSAKKHTPSLKWTLCRYHPTPPGPKGALIN